MHTGAGAGLCALDGGRKVAMATGFDDLDGSPGTPFRQLDPEPVRHLMAEFRMDPGRIEALLRQEAELRGVPGPARDLDRLIGSSEPRARVAVEFFLYRISLALASLVTALSGLDAIVFTASAGPHAAPVRAEICRRGARLGLDFDPAANRAGGPRLTRPGSRVTAWVIPTDKPLLVARRTQAVLG